jgi:hypothetical protein
MYASPSNKSSIKCVINLKENNLIMNSELCLSGRAVRCVLGIRILITARLTYQCVTKLLFHATAIMKTGEAIQA